MRTDGAIHSDANELSRLPGQPRVDSWVYLIQSKYSISALAEQTMDNSMSLEQVLEQPNQ